MLWPLILPLKITFWGLLACVAAATALASRFGRKRSRVFVWSALLAVFAFLPALIGVGFVVDAFRFGTFHYDDYAQVNDFRIYRYLPEGATDITLKKAGGGFQAKFSMSRPELEAWIDEQWRLYGDRSEVAREKANSLWNGQDGFVREFRGFAEPLPSDVVEYGGPVAPNGAGFTIWYDAAQGVAYESAGYW